MEILAMKHSQVSPYFWHGKRVFLTGHTGFKGGWLSLWLTSMGAKVTGYALAPSTSPNLFSILNIANSIDKSVIGDIRDLHLLQQELSSVTPDIVIHMAAQPLVRYSYTNPVETYATNVMGTVHLLESARAIDSIRSTVIVTTDKCYENKNWAWGYRENDALGGRDPYSNSKGCTELVASAYRSSFFSSHENRNAIATARAGNVIGGGDWSDDRLIPDAIRAFEVNKSLNIRYPSATRPWQHVLEPLSGYLLLAQALYEGGQDFASAWNFGPHDSDARTVEEVIELLIRNWGAAAKWEKDNLVQPHEASLLKLDCSKANQYLGWFPQWSLEVAIEKIIDWHKAYNNNLDMRNVTLDQIKQYMSAQ